MEEVVYKPYRRCMPLKWGVICAILWTIILVFYGNLQHFPMIILGTAAICCYALSYRGKIRINSEGIFADVAKTEQNTFIPWAQIKACKYYEGGADAQSVCVLFQRLDFSLSGQCLYAREEGIQLNRAGKILCDVDLRKLSFGRISPEQFSARYVFGITVTEQAYETIYAWWEKATHTFPEEKPIL